MLERSRRWIWVATAVGTLVVAAQTAGAATPRQLVLRPAQVGSGYTVQLFERGDTVRPGQPRPLRPHVPH